MTYNEKVALLKFIRHVIDTGKPWESKTVHYPADHSIRAVLTIKGMKKNKGVLDGNKEGFSSNGWQWDWWQKFTYKGKNYTLSGSGYYGGHSFTLSDE